ncbi:hypothetical protein ABND74_13340 [Paenibacillus larvae]
MRVKTIAMSIWNIIDPIYYSFSRLKCIGQQGRKSTFRVRLTFYRGRDITLSDGTRINKGDILLKLHLHNIILLKNMNSLQNEIAKGRLLYRMVLNSLPDLAEYVHNHPKSREIKGIIGITMLNRGCGSLGFETIPISSKIYKWCKCITMLPIYFLSARSPLKFIKKQAPMYLFMSKHVLLNKYGKIT